MRYIDYNGQPFDMGIDSIAEIDYRWYNSFLTGVPPLAMGQVGDLHYFIDGEPCDMQPDGQLTYRHFVCYAGKYYSLRDCPPMSEAELSERFHFRHVFYA